jgi:hypothetical protein
MALRGPDGSVQKSYKVMKYENKTLMFYFLAALFFFGTYNHLHTYRPPPPCFLFVWHVYSSKLTAVRSSYTSFIYLRVHRCKRAWSGALHLCHHHIYWVSVVRMEPEENGAKNAVS